MYMVVYRYDIVTDLHGGPKSKTVWMIPYTAQIVLHHYYQKRTFAIC